MIYRFKSFKNFVNESEEINAFDVLSIDLKTAVELIIKKHHPKFSWYDYAQAPIFKGLKHTDSNSKYIDFSGYKSERISPNADNNFYNIFLSNDPSWKQYPTRNKSLICTNSMSKANRYGQTYAVIPLKQNIDLGVCPKDDIWMSFDIKEFSRSRRLINDISTVTDSMSYICNALGYDDNVFENWSQTKNIIKVLKEHTAISLRAMIDKDLDKKGQIFVKNFFQAIAIMGGNPEDTNAYKLIVDYFQPEKNKFKVVPYNFSKYARHHAEVWFDAPALLISVDELENTVKFK